MVPQPVVQIKVEEKLIREKHTDVHHITLGQTMQAPVAFAEAAPAGAAWPWWWWLPLILLCCCLPLLCCLLWWLCCRRSKPAPAPTPRKPTKVEKVKNVVKEIPRDETELAKRKKFAYQKHEYDQEREIEEEIQRELEMSRMRKTQVQEEKSQRPVIYHHTRYVEKPRYLEERDVKSVERTATYDAVNRSGSKYQNINDSYYIEQRPSRVERVVERTYNPGVRQSRSTNMRKSYVNPMYQTEGEVNQASRVTSGGYVSKEMGHVSPRRLEVPYAREVQQERVSSRAKGRFYDENAPHIDIEADMGSGRRSNRKSGRVIEESYFNERQGRSGAGDTFGAGGAGAGRAGGTTYHEETRTIGGNRVGSGARVGGGTRNEETRIVSGNRVGGGTTADFNTNARSGMGNTVSGGEQNYYREEHKMRSNSRGDDTKKSLGSYNSNQNLANAQYSSNDTRGEKVFKQRSSENKKRVIKKRSSFSSSDDDDSEDY